MKVKTKPVHYEYDAVYYVPVYQEYFDEEGNFLSSPHIHYHMCEATTDEQMAWSFNPAYVLKLEGHFNYTTTPCTIEEEE